MVNRYRCSDCGRTMPVNQHQAKSHKKVCVALRSK